jgi:hypothetical protein
MVATWLALVPILTVRATPPKVQKKLFYIVDKPLSE